MNDDYLWNKQGRDREVEALEELLEPLAYGKNAAAPAPRRRGPKWGVVLAVLATAAAIALVVRWSMPVTESVPARAPALAAHEIDLQRYGTVRVHEGAVVKLVRQTDEIIRLRLTRGTIEARITLAARPRLFQVETPATTCVDLGCHYTLSVEADGSTFVHVDVGAVAFVENGRETWIPRDASCRAWPTRGSGTPRWDDARPELLAAIEKLDRAPGSERRAAATAVISLCNEPRDALSLWHLAHEADPKIADSAWTKLLERIGAPGDVADAKSPTAAEAWKLHLQSKW